MTTLVLQGDRRVLGVRAESLAVLMDGDLIVQRHPDQVDEVHVYGDGRVSEAARGLCLRRGIDVVFYTPSGAYLGRLTARESRAGERRVAQLETCRDPSRRVAVAREVVAAKLANQVIVLRRAQRRRRTEALADAVVALHAAAARVAEETDVDVVRGVEGMGARAYFQAWPDALANPLFAWPGRVRRPPRDPVNAALSFVYTQLASRCEDVVRGAGLEPFVGFLHEASRGQPACALDLMEPWRPMVDAMVLGLFNRRELSPEDFYHPAGRWTGDLEPPGDTSPAVHLGPVGREIVFRAWSRRLDEPVYHPASEQRLAVRQALVWDAQQLARFVEGKADRFIAFRWS